MIKRIIDILKIKQGEKVPALVAVAYFTILNILTIVKYWDKFSVLTDNYHKLFVRGFKISGFDPLTYEVISRWDTAYNVYRHPLLAFFMWPVNQLNQGLMLATGTNFAIILTAIILIACSTYSFVFLLRILKNVIGLPFKQACLLAGMYFSFSFIMLSSMVPDHFVISECCLLLTLWLSGEKLKRGSALNMWQTIALFTVTAGVSLNNGLKIFLAALITRRMRFFRPGYLLLAVLLPAAFMWGFARWEYRTFVWPKEQARNEIKAKKVKAQHEALRKELRDSMKITGVMTSEDSAKLQTAFKKENQRRAVAKYRKDHKQIWNKNTGKPIAKGEFMRWTDKTTSRLDVGIECLFGEAIMLHEDYLLGDVLRNRPVIVSYRNWFNYIVEALLIMLFCAGIWFGRKSLFMWTSMSFFLMDMALHMGLGFGINEIYIMSAHYLFVIPIAIAYLFKSLASKSRICTMGYTLCTTVAIYLLVWNFYLIAKYLL